MIRTQEVKSRNRTGSSFAERIFSLIKTNTFVTTNLNVKTGKLKNPVKIAVLSDLHNIEYGKNNFDLVEAVRLSHPDMIAVVGDLMTYGNPDYSVAYSLCRQIRNIAPVYYTYGNHEYEMVEFHGSKIGEDLKKIGINVLDGGYKTVNINGNIIAVSGLECNPKFYTKDRQDKLKDFTEDPNFKLLLVHDPGHVDARLKTGLDRKLIGENIDAALCGHRHGGQWGVPGLGGLFMPDVGFFPKYTSGDNLCGKTHVIVSRGLGDHHKIMRINNPHELLVVTFF